MRDKKIDIVKGIGIILMVFYHAECPGRDFIYLFHMALFFICSGYCFNEENSKSPVSYIVKKVKALYIPCLISGLLVVSLNNIFLKIYIYSEQVYSTLDLLSYCKEILKCFMFGGGRQLLGANWFFRTLFFSSVLYMIINLVLEKFQIKGTAKSIFRSTICYVFTCLGCVIGYTISFGKFFNFLTVLSIFDFGFLLKKYAILNKMMTMKAKWFLPAGSFAVLAILSSYGTLSINNNTVKNPVFFSLCSTFGFILVYFIADSLQKITIGKFVAYCGNKSIWIMFFHYIGFKIVTFVEICVWKLPLQYLSEYPTFKTENGLCFIYGMAGVTVSLVLIKLGELITRRRRKQVKV